MVRILKPPANPGRLMGMRDMAMRLRGFPHRGLLRSRRDNHLAIALLVSLLLILGFSLLTGFRSLNVG